VSRSGGAWRNVDAGATGAVVRYDPPEPRHARTCAGRRIKALDAYGVWSRWPWLWLCPLSVVGLRSSRLWIDAWRGSLPAPG